VNQVSGTVMAKRSGARRAAVAYRLKPHPCAQHAHTTTINRGEEITQRKILLADPTIDRTLNAHRAGEIPNLSPQGPRSATALVRLHRVRPAVAASRSGVRRPDAYYAPPPAGGPGKTGRPKSLQRSVPGRTRSESSVSRRSRNPVNGHKKAGNLRFAPSLSLRRPSMSATRRAPRTDADPRLARSSARPCA
jgi:hypothetical protein